MARQHAGPKWRDGRVVKQQFDNGFGAGLQSYLFNLRRPLFQDPRIRRALGYTYDFAAINNYRQYKRTYSMFSNSEFAATGLPGPGELALLEPFRRTLPPEVFGPAWEPPRTDTGPNALRENLLKARALLEEAGWKVAADGVQRNAKGEPFEFEYLEDIGGGGRAVAVWRRDIRGSQIIYEDSQNLPNKPLWKGDPMNLFTVVELGDHHATLLNGDNFKAIHRFQTRFALHGGPKYLPTGRYVYFGSRDGWVSKYDLYNLKYVAEIRAGINMRNIAVSSDGRYVIAANYLPHTLVIFSGEDLSPIKIINAESEGKTSRVSAVYDAAPRNSFVAAFKDIPEVWEINYADKPPMGFGKWIHDFNEESGDGDIGARFPVRKMESTDYIDDFFFTQDYLQLIGASREGKGLVLDFDVGRVITTLDLPGMPHLGSGITWPWHGTTILATPNLKEGSVTFIDMNTWQTIKKIETLGPGFFMRSP